MSSVKNLLIQKIEKVYGKKIEYSYECESLVNQIEEITGEKLALVTLKRFLGFTSAKVEPRGATLDILARFCGYKNYEMAYADLLESSLISEFRKIERIESKKLNKNDIISLTYEPDRKIVLKYLGNSNFIVLESLNSKLKVEDIVNIDSFNLGFELIVNNVVRGEISLGNYIGAKQSGLTSISLEKA